MDRYLGAHAGRTARASASTCPLLLMMSSGGISTVETARRFPVRLVESGPAGGAILARHVAARERLRPRRLVRHGRHDGEDHADRRLHAAAVAPFRGRARLSLRQGQRLAGAHPGDRHGGDRRRRRLDRARRCAAAASRSGPTARAAMPGPACYARGGTAAHGDRCRCRARPHRSRRASPAARSRWIRDARRRRCRRRSARRCSMPVQEAARGIAEIVDETMASAARVHAVENGKDTAEPHADRLRRRGAAACRAAGAEARHAPRRGAGRRRRRLGARLPARADRLRGRAHAAGAARRARARRRSNALFAEMRAEAEAVVRLGVPQASAGRDAHRLHALSRPGPRDRGAAARTAVAAMPRRAARRVRCDLCTRVRPRHPAAGGRGGDLDPVARRTASAAAASLPAAAGCRRRAAGGAAPRCSRPATGDGGRCRAVRDAPHLPRGHARRPARR